MTSELRTVIVGKSDGSCELEAHGPAPEDDIKVGVTVSIRFTWIF